MGIPFAGSNVPLIGAPKTKISTIADVDIPDDFAVDLILEKDDIIKFLDLMRFSYADFMAESISMMMTQGVILTALEEERLANKDLSVLMEIFTRLSDAGLHDSIPCVFIIKLWRAVSLALQSKKKVVVGEDGQ
jgi:hypothetical protein